MKKIQDDSLWYQVVFMTVKFAFSKFYRQTEIRGLDNVPMGEPVIYAPNHQCGLMDPLVVLLNRNEPVVFMARADIFQNKQAAKFLHFLKIMPVFRIRDGFENLGKNEVLFNIAKDVLLDRKKLCVMPEGNHGEQHKLRPLVKGIFRIAFTAEEALHGNGHVRIVPVGIDHSHFQHAGSDVVLTFGVPIHVENYLPEYQENQAIGLNAIRERLAGDLTCLMHDIRSEKNYDLIYTLCCLGAPAYLEVQKEKGISPSASKRAGRYFDARKAIGLHLDELDQAKSLQLEEWKKQCAHLNQLPYYADEIATWMEYKPGFPEYFCLALISLPFLPGMLLNTPAWLLNRKICKGIEDKQMHSTFAFVCGLIINPLVYLLTAIIICLVSASTVPNTLGLIILLGIYGIMAERWRQRMRLPFRNVRYAFGKKHELIKACRQDYRQLKQSIKKWICT